MGLEVLVSHVAPTDPVVVPWTGVHDQVSPGVHGLHLQHGAVVRPSLLAERVLLSLDHLPALRPGSTVIPSQVLTIVLVPSLSGESVSSVRE